MNMSQYRDLFVSESRIHISDFNNLMVRLESNTAEQGIIDELFRHAHSLKGMAATMKIQAIVELAHKMEGLLNRVRRGEFALTSFMVDLLLEGSDALGSMIALIEAGHDQMPEVTGLVNRLDRFIPDSSLPQPSSFIRDTAGPKATKNDQGTPMQHLFQQSDSSKSIRIKSDTLDHLVNITGELITTRYHLDNQAQLCPEAALEEPLNRLSRLLRELRDEVFHARMLPFSNVTGHFPRLVRDLARKQGKDVSLSIESNEIELDRGILEKIVEPLVHILRNAVDHGVETPDERIAAGKERSGAISITVTRDKDHVRIAVSDDGRGMNSAFLTAKAVEKGIIDSSQAGAMTHQEALMLVCAPGFSTAAAVSDISGRGVGMDAVRNAVHNLGGTLSINSETGRGSSFILRLPSSVSIINALLVQCGTMTIAIPVNTVDRALELGLNDIFQEDGRKVCALDARSVPLKSLNLLLGQPTRKDAAPCAPAVVTGMNSTPAGFLTDRILGQQEIFVKPLAPPLSRMRGITGGTILGDGRIVFVMDISMLA